MVLKLTHEQVKVTCPPKTIVQDWDGDLVEVFAYDDDALMVKVRWLSPLYNQIPDWIYTSYNSGPALTPIGEQL